MMVVLAALHCTHTTLTHIPLNTIHKGYTITVETDDCSSTDHSTPAITEQCIYKCTCAYLIQLSEVAVSSHLKLKAVLGVKWSHCSSRERHRQPP